ncbi:MAG: response regulator transcription factor [Burkholderiales bacterium]
MIRLLIADDHTLVRGGLRQIFALVKDFEVVGEASNGTEVLDLLRQHPCDLLLLDLDMPGLRGAELIEQIRAQQSDLPVLMLSMHNDPAVVARMLKAGVNGFITKDCEPVVLLTAIRAVAAHGNYIDPSIAVKMVFDEASSASSATHQTLSERELQIFHLLTQGHSLVAIGEQLFISSKTVSTHKARLMEKLQVDNMADLMRYAMQHNLLSAS